MNKWLLIRKIRRVMLSLLTKISENLKFQQSCRDVEGSYDLIWIKTQSLILICNRLFCLFDQNQQYPNWYYVLSIQVDINLKTKNLAHKFQLLWTYEQCF